MKRLFFAATLLMTSFMMGCNKESNDVQNGQTKTVTNAVSGNNDVILKSTSNSDLSEVQISSVILYAGQTMNAGTVSIYQTDTNGDHTYDAIKVTYSLTGDWTFNTKIHFYIGTGPIPSNSQGNYVPGDFPYVFTPDMNPYSFIIPFTSLGFQGCSPIDLMIAAHAELYSPTFGQQTGFGAGTKTGKNWFTSYNLTLADKTPPTASNVTLNVECIGDVPSENPNVITDAKDNCTLAATPVTFVSEANDGKTCPTTIIRTFLISDAAGNTTTAMQTITVQDKTAPILSGQGENVLLACASEFNFVTPKATDNCDTNPTITFVDKETKDANGKTTSITRTWTAVDICGNLSLPVSQTFTLDVVAPVLIGDVNSTIGCSVPVIFTQPTATDNYDTNPIITIKGVDFIQTLGYITSTTRTWIATDKCGNSSETSQTIVKDCTPIAPPTGWLPGTGTGWAYLSGSSTDFNSLSPKTGNNWGWTNKLVNGTTHQVFTLYVGVGQNVITKGTPVGSVTVDYVGSSIKVAYEVINLCNITEAHLYIGTTPLPMNKQKNYISAPGQLGYNSGTLSTTKYTFTVPNTFGSLPIYMAAHAVVVVK